MISLVSTSTSFGTSNVEDNISKFINAKLSTRFINNPSELSRIANRISSQSLPRPSYMDTYKLTASQALTQIRSGKLKIEDYALSLLSRINQRDGVIKAWAYIDPEYVLAQAKRLDLVPFDERGPIHGMPIAVKDVIYTKDMPTKHNSPIYADSFPKVDAASIQILRHAGALILGKTTTSEFAAIHRGPATINPNSLPPHNPIRTPGGSSSGSGAAVADFHAPIALATQTGGSTIRPASFNGIYGFKPTWGAISREGQKLYAYLLDTLGMYARCVDDLELLADCFDLKDDEPTTFGGNLHGAKFAVCKTSVWEHAGPGTRNALAKAVELLRANGAIVDEIELPEDFDPLPAWHHVVLQTEGRSAFLSDYRVGKDKMDDALIGHVENRHGYSRKKQLEAFDGIARLRPLIDEILGGYEALLTPSVIDEATLGTESTGSAIFCQNWTTLHVPVINLPGFQGANAMPIGVSLVAARYRDRHLLKVSKTVGDIFVAHGK